MTEVLLPDMREEVNEYFRISGICSLKRLNHNPFIVFIEKENVKVEIVDNISDLLENYPDGTKVISQWGGKWRSDFFKYKVGDLRKFVKNNPEELC